MQKLSRNEVIILSLKLVLLSSGFIMTVSRPCYFGNLLLGVVGVDVNLAYILEDVTYYQDSLASYTFLIDNKGQYHRDRSMIQKVSFEF